MKRLITLLLLVAVVYGVFRYLGLEAPGSETSSEAPPLAEPAEPEEPAPVAPTVEVPAEPVSEEPRPLDHFLPDIAGYSGLEDAPLGDLVEAFVEGTEANLLAEEEQALVDSVTESNDILDCYTKAGVFGRRSYASESQLTGFGMIGVLDQSTLTSPKLLAECIAKPALEGLSPFGTDSARDDDAIGLCRDKYETEWAGNTFHVFYAGTTRKVCRELCGALEGCVDPYAGSEAGGGSSD